MSDTLPKSWVKLPGAVPTRYAPAFRKFRQTDIVLDGVDGDNPPTPQGIAEFFNTKNSTPEWHFRSWDCLLKKGLVLKNDQEQEDDSEQVVLPSGYYEYDPDTDPVTMVESPLRTDKAIHLGDVQTLVEKDLTLFLNNKKTFDELKCQYKRGYLLYGPPGTGKSTLIRLLIRRLLEEEPTLAIDMSRIPTAGVLKRLRKDPRRKVFVFEELTEVNSYSARDLLTFLDGENSVDNSVVIATTNYSGSLPANIVARPGRFDLVLRVPDPDSRVRAQLLSFWLGRDPTDDEIEATGGLITAAIREAALQSRLKGTAVEYEVDIYRRRVEVADRDFGDMNKEIGF